MQDKSGSSSPKSTCVSYNGTSANVEFRTSSTNALQHKEIGNGHAIKDKSGSSSPKSTCVSYNGTSANVEFRTSSTNALQHKEIGNGHAIKARKPYTISKQRERWTKEEHDKFLEALKLYGRAWRRIEEHVGSKTAVQIRSHAQKFFSKVSRESTADCSVKAVEIPPARPKRKPSRPYPRNRSPVLEKLECSPLWISSNFEQKGSPTSVLTAAESETMKSGISNLLNGCASPVLSVVGSNPVGMSWSDPVEENRSSSTCPASTGLTADQKFSTESNSGLDQDSPMETQAATLKLFGMTVLVTDSQKPCSSIDRDSMQSPNPSNSTEIQSTNMVGGDPFGASGMWPIGVPPVLFVMPSYADPVAAAVGSPLFPLSWWLSSCGKESVVSPSLESSPNSAFRRVKSGSNMSAKGFVPYTRCVAERDVHNPLMADIDEDGGLNLCL